MKHKYCLITVDTESISLVNNNSSKETAELVYMQGMPRILELFNKYQIKATFFFTGEIVEKIPDIVRLVTPYGHEVACHGYSHDINEAFDLLNLNDQIKHLLKTKSMLEVISKQEVISFRAPALRVNEFTPKALLKTGFKIDSSIASQRFDFFLSFGTKRKINRIIAPRYPYFVSENDLAKRGNTDLLEIPITALIFPYIGTTMRVFPKTTALFRKLFILESNITGKPINFLTHPNEFIEEDKKNRSFNRRTRNPISFLLADWLRYHLKLKNLGDNGMRLFENEIVCLKKKGFTFITLQDYRLKYINGEL